MLCLATVGAGAPSFPLKADSSGRHLVDQSGTPVLVLGEAAWSITHNLTYEEAVAYLEDRRSKGFNALIVSVPDAYGRDKVAEDPPDRQGHKPFIDDDITRPNEAYWAHVDRVLATTQRKGFLVLLWPFYLGCCDDGYMDLFQRNGVARAREYGRFVGHRYGHLENLVWIHGGDHDPDPVRRLVVAVKEGIEEVAPPRLHAVHWAPETNPYGPFGAGFTDLYTTYTYEPVAGLVTRHYRHQPTKPVVLLETHYEHDWAGKTSEEVLPYPYQALLSGAVGYYFGNSPLWYSGFGWEEALNSAGSRAMSLVGRLFRSRPWWRLIPDHDRTLVVEGGGAPVSDKGVQAACADDGSFAMAFMPDQGRIVVDLEQLSGTSIRATWYDIRSGALHPAGNHNRRRQALSSPSGGPFVLILDDLQRGFALP